MGTVLDFGFSDPEAVGGLGVEKVDEGAVLIVSRSEIYLGRRLGSHGGDLAWSFRRLKDERGALAATRARRRRAP